MRVTESTVVNLPLFKLIGLYRMADPHGPKIFDRNAFRLLIVTAMWFTISLTAVSVIGLFWNEQEYVDVNTIYETLLLQVNNVMTVVKLRTMVANSQTIWKLFDVSKVDFVSAKLENSDKLVECRQRTTRMTSFFVVFVFANNMCWIMLPIIFSHFNSDGRRTNALNFIYPLVTVHDYNAYFVVIYIIETIGTCIISYGIIIFDVFLVSFCMAISAQYEVVQSKFEHLELSNDCGINYN